MNNTIERLNQNNERHYWKSQPKPLITLLEESTKAINNTTERLNQSNE